MIPSVAMKHRLKAIWTVKRCIRRKKCDRIQKVRCIFCNRAFLSANLKIAHSTKSNLLCTIEVQMRFCYMKSLFERAGGTYTVQGDYCLPNISLPPQKEGNVGVWGQRRLRFLKQHHKVLYYNLLTSGKLQSHLADIEQQAQELFLLVVNDLVKKEGVTETLKAENQMEWVQQMNNIRNQATEIVNIEVIRL